MNEQEKIVRLLTIIAECQIYSIWDEQSSRAKSLIQELFDLKKLEGGEDE